MLKVPRKNHLANIGELAAALSDATGERVAISTVGGWVRDRRWAWSKKAPWDSAIIPDVLRWRADQLIKGRPENDEDDSSETTVLRKEKLREEVRKLRAQADTAETALHKERGRLIDASEVERDWSTVGTIVRTGFQNISSQVVPLALGHGMPHESAAVFQNQVEELVFGVLRRLSNAATEDDEDSETEVSSKPVSA